MSGVLGYIVVRADGSPLDDEFGFGATTLFKDWNAAVGQAKATGGARLVPVIAARSSSDTPRRGRPRKQETSE